MSASSIIYILSLILAMISIQSGAALAKSLFPVLGTLGTTVFRVTFSAMILTLIWRPWRFKITREQLKLIAVYGVALGGMNLLFYLSIERIPLGVAVALEFAGPLAVAVLQSRRWVDFIWVGFACVGVFLLSPLNIFSLSYLDSLGVAYALAAGGCWAFYILFGQKAGQKVPLGIATSVGMVFSALTVLPFYLAWGSLTPPLEALPVALLVAVLSSALPYSLEMLSLRRLSTRAFGILMSMEPMIAVLSGWLFLQEGLGYQQGIAILLIIIASAGTVITQQSLPEK